ncbi:MAG: hypothetical protein AAF685_17210 [Cyanobacteria bacterium P01_C01_bin.89]
MSTAYGLQQLLKICCPLEEIWRFPEFASTELSAIAENWLD